MFKSAIKSKDSWGILFSGLCLVHCLATPFFLLGTGGGVFGLFMASQTMHQLMIIPVIIISLFSFLLAYKKHRNVLPGLLAVFAVIGLIIAVTYLSNSNIRVISGYNYQPYQLSSGYRLDSHTITTLIGSSMLIFAHIWNWGLSKTYQRNKG